MNGGGQQTDGRCPSPRRPHVEQAIEIAFEHGISVYDASYVAAARRNGWLLVSTDCRDLVGRGLALAPAEALAGD